MPPQSNIISTVENNFTKGLVTEFTGLNFPENAATDCDNCLFTLVGDVTRREGIDLETNFVYNNVNPSANAIATYKWNNAGGDGNTQVIVNQVGGTLYFYKSSAITEASPISANKLSATITVSTYTAGGATFDPSIECQFADGNGYLFVYNQNCDPFYCTYNAGTITANIINVQVRDFTGVVDGLGIGDRPSSLSSDHQYNLQNQGWTSGNAWAGRANQTNTISTGSAGWAIGAGIAGISNGQFVTIYYEGGGSTPIPSHTPVMTGSVTNYSSGTLTVNITWDNPIYAGDTGTVWTIIPTNTGFITSWQAAVGNYPSNADVWWYFKDSTDIFNPTVTAGNVSLATGNAPQGHYILNAFIQDRASVSTVSGITAVTTKIRPRTGTWFQGRVWYTGVDAQQPSTGDANFYTWTENIYFSQVVTTVADFGTCYQTNDPTSENLFDLLPTDGGVITIQGSGSIYKLFPIQNGMLVFAANGVWFITGSQGIGFSANDYTITKISNIQSISSTSFVDVMGLPFFWNEEGIYSVEPNKGGGLAVNPITVGTILTYYNEIPTSSKAYARGAYDPVGYTIQWLFKSTEAATTTDRYVYDKILNFNTYNKAFYPYSVDTTQANLCSIIYVTTPGGVSVPTSILKYLVTATSGITFADEHDTNYVDWASTINSVNYTSYFITGYRLHGQGQRRFQIPYLYTFSRGIDPTSFKIQGIWDYALSGNTGRFSNGQLVNNNNPNFGVIIRRHKLRGRGLVLQMKVTSMDGLNFDLMGWSTFEIQNVGV